jgi:hypothetical protein
MATLSCSQATWSTRVNDQTIGPNSRSRPLGAAKMPIAKAGSIPRVLDKHKQGWKKTHGSILAAPFNRLSPMSIA